MEEILTDTITPGEVEEVHVAPIGQFYGSDSEGNPVAENLTPGSLQAIADDLNAKGEDVLCDFEHKSAVGEFSQRESKAAGWLDRWVFKPMLGLFARLKLTKSGRAAVEDRTYRFLSPVFQLDEEGTPVSLQSVALTNTPALKDNSPILNAEPTASATANPEEKQTTEEKLTMEFTKEELVQLIKDTIAETQAENACAEEEKKEEVVNEEPAAEEKPAEEKPAANACSDEDEVVKAEALNSSSEKQVALQAVKEPEWANLHGAEFFSELRKHPEWR